MKGFGHVTPIIIVDDPDDSPNVHYYMYFLSRHVPTPSTTNIIMIVHNYLPSIRNIIISMIIRDDPYRVVGRRSIGSEPQRVNGGRRAR